MEILTLKIREDLRKHRQNMRALWMARWRWLQLLVLGCGLLVAIYSLLPQRWPIHQAIPLLLFAPMLMLTGLQPFIHTYRKRFLLITLLVFVYIILVLAAGFLDPDSPATTVILPAWTSWLTLIIPFISWGLLIRIFLNSPTHARQYSIRPNRLFGNLMIGLGCGLAAALHLYLVSYFIADIEFPPVTFSREGILWAGCVLMGIVVPAEELVFRGAAFSILFDELNIRFSDVVLRITAINMLIYLVIIASSHAILPFDLLNLVYRTVLSALSIFLVWRRRSLVPGMLANLVFSLATGWLFYI